MENATAPRYREYGQSATQSDSAFMLAVAQEGRLASRVIKKPLASALQESLSGEDSGFITAYEKVRASLRVLKAIADTDPSLTCHLPSGDRADPSFSYGPRALYEIVSGIETKRTKAFDRSCVQ